MFSRFQEGSNLGDVGEAGESVKFLEISPVVAY